MTTKVDDDLVMKKLVGLRCDFSLISYSCRCAFYLRLNEVGLLKSGLVKKLVVNSRLDLIMLT
ncbi:hypothetical protein Gotur_016327 [Gossypium turneri]